MPATRLPTRIPGFDELVGGGLLANCVYIVSGAPGAGKTILASQLCVNAACGGAAALYVTLTTETHGKLIANLEAFSFFDPDVVARGFKLISGMSAVEDAGLTGLLALLRGIMVSERPRFLVIDGFRYVHERGLPATEVKRFAQGLQALLSLIGAAAILLESAPAGTIDAEHTVVDGLIDLEERAQDRWTLRQIVVRKFRGSAHMSGRHTFTISDDGIRVFPRIEARAAAHSPMPPSASLARVRTGVGGLDRLVDGGLEVGSTTLMFGATGSGKTTFGLHFLAEAARTGEPAVHFGFFEQPPALMRQADRFGAAFADAVRGGRIHLVWQPPVEQPLDVLGERLLDAVRRSGARRLFIDGLVGFREATPHPARLSRFFAALAYELRALGVTSMITEEAPALFGRDIQVPTRGVSALWENILYLRRVEWGNELRWMLSVFKTRDTAHDQGFYDFEIGKSGVVMRDRFPRPRGTLTGEPSLSRADERDER